MIDIRGGKKYPSQAENDQCAATKQAKLKQLAGAYQLNKSIMAIN